MLYAVSRIFDLARITMGYMISADACASLPAPLFLKKLCAAFVQVARQDVSPTRIEICLDLFLSLYRSSSVPFMFFPNLLSPRSQSSASQSTESLPLSFACRFLCPLLLRLTLSSVCELKCLCRLCRLREVISQGRE